MDDKLRQQFEDYSIELNRRFYHELDGNFELLQQAEQEVVRIRRLETDMYNGGFIQYFCNWGYDNFLATLYVLEKVQALQSREILAECEKTLSPLSEDERIKELWDIPKYIDLEMEEKLVRLDRRYWENPDDLLLLCYHYFKGEGLL